MRNTCRLAAVASTVAAALILGACADTGPMYRSTYPTGPSGANAATQPVAGTEWGRITSIEYIPVGSTTSNNSGVIGAIVGGLVGGVIGSNIGQGSGRTAATVLGAGAGALAGNRIARNASGATTAAGYRVTVQMDGGAWRTYEVGATGDLRVGDRVRVENGVIYRG